jgi:hypothetical protein
MRCRRRPTKPDHPIVEITTQTLDTADAKVSYCATMHQVVRIRRNGASVMWIQRARTAPPSIVVPAQAETSGVQRICDVTATPLGSRLRGNDVQVWGETRLVMGHDANVWRNDARTDHQLFFFALPAFSLVQR